GGARWGGPRGRGAGGPGGGAGRTPKRGRGAAGGGEERGNPAGGISPPLLADLGLRAALEAQARKAAMPVTVEAAGLGRYPQKVEAAVYFCVLEALQNVAKYAQASAAHGTPPPPAPRLPSPLAHP